MCPMIPRLFSLMSLVTVGFFCPEAPTAKLPELRVMLLGKPGAGKSTSGNTILGREAFKAEVSAGPVTKYCESHSGVIDGRKVMVIDTPGIAGGSWQSGPEGVNPCLRSPEHAPHVLLLVLQLGRLTEHEGDAVKWIQQNFGQEALGFTIVLFTGGDQLKEKTIEMLLNENPHLVSLIGRGGYYVFNNKLSAGHRQARDLMERIEDLLLENIGYFHAHNAHRQILETLREEEERRREEMTHNLTEKESQRMREREKMIDREREQMRKEQEMFKVQQEKWREEEKRLGDEEKRKVNAAVAEIQAQCREKIQRMEEQRGLKERERMIYRVALFIVFGICVVLLVRRR